jgi:hypothetical protein
MGIEIMGRDTELAKGAAFLEGVQAGPGALVVEGAAGIGKTILLRALVEGAVDGVIRCCPARPSAPRPVWPW